GHRGGRGEAIENTLPAFAWGLIDGVTTLELDNGISKAKLYYLDGVVIVWHDEEITPDKCTDTIPVVASDPIFPYVGKHIANLTLAQIKTLDCGSKRLSAYPLQLIYPGTKLSTLDELFDFAHCVDPKRVIEWNIESKINPVDINSTRGVNDFVTAQHKAFLNSGYPLSQITYQSFDWRTLIAMKALDKRIPTSALIDDTTIYGPSNTTSQWQAGLVIDSFEGATSGEKVANAAAYIKAQVLSTAAVSSQGNATDPADPGYVPFTTKAMIDQAHKNGVLVKPWTADRLNIVSQLLDWGADGIISDYPTNVRRQVQQSGKAVAPKFEEKAVLACLNKHLQKV
ncbi:PLC-like phosphodiesterase, partial [Crepidotus variabilis]